MIARYCLLTLVLLGIPGRSQDAAEVHERRAAKPPQNTDDFLFEVQPRVIAAGDTALLRWSIKGATKVTIEEASESSRELRKLGTFGRNGSLEVKPKVDTTYIISCEGSTTYSCASVTVRVRVKKR
jgi:hypothetical protein